MRVNLIFFIILYLYFYYSVVVSENLNKYSLPYFNCNKLIKKQN